VRTISQLEDSVVLITGAARGIGRACAQTFAAQKARVALCDIDLSEAQKAAKELQAAGHVADAWQLDVRDARAWATVVAAITDQWGPVDVLVGNAGIMPVGPVLEMDEKTRNRLMDVNIGGIFNGVEAVLPAMLDRGQGHLVHIASLAGRIPMALGGPYCATKFAVVGYGESLHQELRGTGVVSTVVHPGYVETELVAGLPQPRWPPPVTPQAVAEAILRGVSGRRRRVYIPWYGGLLALLPWVLPEWASHGLGSMLGAHTLFQPEDESARASYRQRVAAEE